VSASPGFKLLDAASYDDVALTFDSLSERYNTGFSERLVALARVAAGDRVLDVGTGTGLCALAAARAALGRAQVLGVDLSDGMLRVAREKALRAGLTADFDRMDAERLELEDASCDVVLSLFALLHFPDPARALGEMRRVLKPGGRLALAAGSAPPLLSRFAARRALELLAERLARAPKLRAPEALEALLEQMLPARQTEQTELARHGPMRAARLDRLVADAGFRVSAVHWEGLETEIEDPEEFWILQRTFSSLARKRLGAAAPADAEAVRTALLGRARAVLALGGRLVYRRAASFVLARRPAS